MTRPGRRGTGLTTGSTRLRRLRWPRSEWRDVAKILLGDLTARFVPVVDTSHAAPKVITAGRYQQSPSGPELPYNVAVGC